MRVVVLLAAIGLTGWAYAPSRSQPVIYEEMRTIPWHHLTPADLAQSLMAVVTVKPRALTTLTLRLNAYYAHQSGWPFRAVNVGWHVVNGFLLALIGMRLMGAWGGIVAASVFLVHPINVQAVTYLAARGDLVSTTGVLLALWASLSKQWWLVALGLILALTGKESAIVGLPLVLWVLWRTDRLSLSKWMLIAAVPVLLFGARLIWSVLLLGEVGDPLILSRGPLAFAGVQLFAVTRWLWLTVRLQGFSIDPDFEAWLGRWIVLAACGWVVALGIGWTMRRTRPWLLTGLGWVLIALGPRLLLPTSEFVTEHQGYLALIGIWFLCGATYEAVVCRAPGMVADCGRARADVDCEHGGRGGVADGRSAVVSRLLMERA